MKDRELLELAAKAAEISSLEWREDDYGEWYPYVSDERWNPLNDDGDALRLAVKLGLLVDADKSIEASEAWGGGIPFVREDWQRHSNPFAATRRHPRPQQGGAMSGWIGVDLDGTLAVYDGWKGPDHIGDPVPLMAQRVRKWLADGWDIRIFTARASVPEQVPPIQEWCELHFGVALPVTNVKDFAMVELWDDRAVQVIPNTGARADRKEDA